MAESTIPVTTRDPEETDPPAVGMNEAVRLGWVLAEARGRYRMGDSPRLQPAAGLPSRMGNALPLADERSPAEQRIETERVLVALAKEWNIDFAWSESKDHTISFTEQLPDFAQSLAAARAAGDATRARRAWNDMSEFLYQWDAQIQDDLAGRSFGTASAYQLGRAVAELYWALDPDAPPSDPASWEFVMGPHRRDQIAQLLRRLAGHFSPFTASAVSFSVGRWSTLAADRSWRAQPDVLRSLADQCKLWRSLLVSGDDPKALLDPRALLARARQVGTIASSFLAELLLLLVGAGVLAAGAYLLKGSGSHAWATVATVLGGLGVTTAGLAARVKSLSTDLFTKVQDLAYQDAIDAAATLCPVRGKAGSPAALMSCKPPGIDHVVVLMLENRSFDHMLGYLPHPDPTFDGLLRNGPYRNPGWPGTPDVATSPDAKSVMPVCPDHSHDAIMEQLALVKNGSGMVPTNRGFVQSYEREARGLDVPKFGGLIGLVLNWWQSRQRRPVGVFGRGPLIMRCQDPKNVPVLSTLALEFGVCTRWFSSVPGETWPNRNFLHAATSDGETDIDLRLYTNKTIFELLEQHHHSWRIYYDDTPQVWAFPALWDKPNRLANWFEFSAFAQHVAAGDLADYTFIEPNHRPPVHTPDDLNRTELSDSQHPGNNLVPNDRYDDWPDNQPTDFGRAESLIADIYECLRKNPDLFNRTLFVITYDEHGGLYDHVPPPSGVPNPGRDLTVLRWFFRALYHRRSKAFDFSLLGARVPAIVVSPYVRRGTVDAEVRDHTTVAATLRALFAPAAEPLSARDAWAKPLLSLLSLRAPRTDVPCLDSYTSGAQSRRVADTQVAVASKPAAAPVAVEHYDPFVDLSERVRGKLSKRGNRLAISAKGAAEMPRLTSDAFRQQADEDRSQLSPGASTVSA